MLCKPSVSGCESWIGVEGNRVKKQKIKTSGEASLPVAAVVNPTHLLAGLQQVEDPCSAAALLLHLRVTTFDLRLGLCVYVQRLFI